MIIDVMKITANLQYVIWYLPESPMQTTRYAMVMMSRSTPQRLINPITPDMIETMENVTHKEHIGFGMNIKHTRNMAPAAPARHCTISDGRIIVCKIEEKFSVQTFRNQGQFEANLPDLNEWSLGGRWQFYKGTCLQSSGLFWPSLLVVEWPQVLLPAA